MYYTAYGILYQYRDSLKLFRKRSIFLKRSSFINTKKASEILGITERRVRALCLNGRVIGAFKAGRDWIIPVDTEGKPELIKGRLTKRNRAKQ